MRRAFLIYGVLLLAGIGTLLALPENRFFSGDMLRAETLSLLQQPFTTRPVPPGMSDVNQQPLPLPLIDPRIVVLKRERALQLYADGKLARVYPVGLGFHPVPDKIREGDGATPEGEFYVYTRNPKSKFYFSLGISYPNVEDAERGLASGLIAAAEHAEITRAIGERRAPPQKTALGGNIFIHGRGAHRDWTRGCVALEDDMMRELFDAVPVGTPVIIQP